MTERPVFLLVAPTNQHTMTTIMTYTTEQERKKNIIIALTKAVENTQHYASTKMLQESYKTMYEALKDIPEEERLEWIENCSYEVKKQIDEKVSDPEFDKGQFVVLILGKLFSLIFALTYKDLKGDLLEAMKSLA